MGKEKAKTNKKPMTLKEFASLGGKATLKKHGKKHYAKMIKARWAKKGK